jgi:hypothetical protein
MGGELSSASLTVLRIASGSAGLVKRINYRPVIVLGWRHQPSLNRNGAGYQLMHTEQVVQFRCEKAEIP